MQVGEKAPDFTAQATLNDEIQNEFKLSDVNRDKVVVLAFYPLDFTSG
jgi:alkyl hydroperoxide reductase subunit AhpC